MENNQRSKILDEAERSQRNRLMPFLAILGMAMIVIGIVADAITGAHKTQWLFLSILGIFPLMAVLYVWAPKTKD